MRFCKIVPRQKGFGDKKTTEMKRTDCNNQKVFKKGNTMKTGLQKVFSALREKVCKGHQSH